MKMTDNQQSNRDYQQDERQRKAIRILLYRMIDELEGRPATSAGTNHFRSVCWKKRLRNRYRV